MSASDDCQLPGCLFVDVDVLPADAYGFIQLLFLMMVYGYILSIGANMIGEGAEALLQIPSLAPLVGPIVLPVLGAVPDAAIVFFSGMGPDAQQQLSVGIGALAGSTVMLLTIPWFASIYGGLVYFVVPKELTDAGKTEPRLATADETEPYKGQDGNNKWKWARIVAPGSRATKTVPLVEQFAAVLGEDGPLKNAYSVEVTPEEYAMNERYGLPKAKRATPPTRKENPTGLAVLSGVKPDQEKIKNSAIVMVITLISYIVIQMPAMGEATDKTVTKVPGEQTWALVALIITCILFLGNLGYQYVVGKNDPESIAQLRLASRREKLAGRQGYTAIFGDATIEMAHTLMDHMDKAENIPSGEQAGWWRAANHTQMEFVSTFECVCLNKRHSETFERLREMFSAHDTEYETHSDDGDGKLSQNELAFMLSADMGEDKNTNPFFGDKMSTTFAEYDQDSSGFITFWEFVGIFIDLAMRDKMFDDYIESENLGKPWQPDAKDYQNPLHPNRGDKFCAILQHTVDKIEAERQTDVEKTKRYKDVPRTSSAEDEAGELEDEPTPAPLSRKAQQSEDKHEAFVNMGVGTLLVLLFSDPMVDCLSDLGTRTGVSEYNALICKRYADWAAQSCAHSHVSSSNRHSGILHWISAGSVSLQRFGADCIDEDGGGENEGISYSCIAAMSRCLHHEQHAWSRSLPGSNLLSGSTADCRASTVPRD
eukprot:SAG31_NODE_4237_length_3431_cov_9.478992_1_plen_711_part_00